MPVASDHPVGDLCSNRHGDGALPSQGSPEGSLCEGENGRERSRLPTEHLKQSEKLYSKKRGSILLDFKWKNAEIAAGP